MSNLNPLIRLAVIAACYNGSTWFLEECTTETMSVFFRYLLAAFSIALMPTPASNAAPFQAPQVRGLPIQLFDGNTLHGWGQQNGNPAENWAVDEGTIAWQSKGGNLYHQHWYRDFELSFDWKLSAGGNSGVKYRVQQFGKHSLGCEYQIFDDALAGPFNKQSTGSLYALYEPGKNKIGKPMGEWNRSRIVVCANHIEHWLNGIKVVDATLGSPNWAKRVSISKFSQLDGFGLNREGRIFLQDHGNPVWFRSIVVTPLDCDGTPGLATSCQR